MNSISLSIVIPVYNPGKYLKDCFESILEYNGNNIFEVIAIDDGSTDSKTIAILDEYKGKFQYFNLITQNNQGPTSARNNGCEIARGGIILFFDSDNILYPNVCIDKALQLFRENPDISIIYGERVFFRDNSVQENRYFQSSFSIEELCDHSMIDMCAFIRKKVWVKNGGFDTKFRFCEDWDFWLTAYENGFKFLQIPKVWFNYRIDVPNSVGTLGRDPEIAKQTMSNLFAKHYDLFYSNYRRVYKRGRRFDVLYKLKMKYRRLFNR